MYKPRISRRVKAPLWPANARLKVDLRRPAGLPERDWFSEPDLQHGGKEWARRSGYTAICCQAAARQRGRTDRGHDLLMRKVARIFDAEPAITFDTCAPRSMR